ncbi:hypothetical protein AGRA3207_005424 [Actinomadura graeca]|uniref:RRXRR domain-containing protein n=1 Tax=Actinomadura graeca TaxID=2750812 RepID=A0ABX8R1P1_9ACTN|nr:hypothetical protein [Actinomadura graeca]QXJ24159.1 hypothetical protein AGRA3207_005424 [Actinomadura graeca]
MFWRKQRAAIERFHPLHRALVLERGFTVSLYRDDWEPVIQSLAGHDQHVRRRKWAPPERAAGVVVPLLRVLAADMRPEGVLSVAADLRGTDVAEKNGPAHELPVQRPVLSVKQWYAVDPWLRVRAELRDGSVLELAVTERLRKRQIRKRNPRGKIKVKGKSKSVHLVRVTRRLPKGAAISRPGAPPPEWIKVQVRQGNRMVIRTNAKINGSRPDAQLTEGILLVSAEPFRWTPPGTAAPGARRTT